jgi:hypothetical protein
MMESDAIYIHHAMTEMKQHTFDAGNAVFSFRRKMAVAMCYKATSSIEVD